MGTIFQMFKNCAETSRYIFFIGDFSSSLETLREDNQDQAFVLTKIKD
jgi:hypothetical protein